MVSDQVYFLRKKGDEEWSRFNEHPCRPDAGVVRLWANSNQIEDETIIEIAASPTSEPREVLYLTSE